MPANMAANATPTKMPIDLIIYLLYHDNDFLSRTSGPSPAIYNYIPNRDNDILKRSVIFCFL